MLANSKFGDCTRCPTKNTACRKRGKYLVCLLCCKTEDNGKQIQKSNEKMKLRGLVSAPENIKIISQNDPEQQSWYIDRSKEMTGVCRNCGGKTTKGDVKYWKYSICHILAKGLFTSVAKHPLNFIELCHFGESCHANFDNNGYEYVRNKMPTIWNIVVTRFKAMYPRVREKSKIPQVLLDELTIEEYEQ